MPRFIVFPSGAIVPEVKGAQFVRAGERRRPTQPVRVFPRGAPPEVPRPPPPAPQTRAFPIGVEPTTGQDVLGDVQRQRAVQIIADALGISPEQVVTQTTQQAQVVRGPNVDPSLGPFRGGPSTLTEDPFIASLGRIAFETARSQGQPLEQAIQSARRFDPNIGKDDDTLLSTLAGIGKGLALTAGFIGPGSGLFGPTGLGLAEPGTFLAGPGVPIGSTPQGLLPGVNVAAPGVSQAGGQGLAGLLTTASGLPVISPGVLNAFTSQLPGGLGQAAGAAAGAAGAATGAGAGGGLGGGGIGAAGGTLGGLLGSPLLGALGGGLLGGISAATAPDELTATIGPVPGQPLLGAAQEQLQSTLQGDFLTGGPGFDAAFQAARNQILPDVRSRFALAGRTGSGLAQAAETQALADAFAGLVERERNRQITGLGLVSPLLQQRQVRPLFSSPLQSGLGGALAGARLFSLLGGANG